ncbi:MAG: type II secretion system F family protein, partial [Cyanobacteria bacterium P01_E01_bin.43]
AGLTVAQALETIANSGAPPQIERVAQHAQASLLAGDGFSRALDQTEAGYPAYAICALEAGESSGQLAEVAETLASYFETARMDRASIANAMLYPAFVAGVAILVALTLMRTVAPEIARLYATTGRELPAVTQALSGATDFLFAHAAALGIALLLTLAGAAFALRRPGPRRVWDRLRRRLPLIGRFMQLEAAAQYLRTLAVVIQSRQPVAAGVQSAINVLSVEDFREDASAAATAIQRGQSLSAALAPMSFIPPVASQLIDAGEQSGRLARMVDRAALMMENDLNNGRKQVIALLEPVLMVLIGLMVLTIVLAVLLPIFDLQADIMP